jgi:hypothetical protein
MKIFENNAQTKKNKRAESCDPIRGFIARVWGAIKGAYS